MANSTIRTNPCVDLTSQITVASPLPTGVTGASVKAAQTGHTVQVYAVVTRDSNSMISYQTIATGLPKPKLSALSIGGTTYAMGFGWQSSDAYIRPLAVMVSQEGTLRVARGGSSGNFVLTFCYLTDDLP